MMGCVEDAEADIRRWGREGQTCVAGATEGRGGRGGADAEREGRGCEREASRSIARADG
jgi:hypothetical protein